MSSPIDPFRAFRPRPDDGEAWLQLWGEATRWWVAPVVGGRDLVTAKEQLLVELIDGLRGRFEGRQIELVLGGSQLRAVLDSIRLRRPGAHYAARVELRDVDRDGWRLETLSIEADSVKIEPFPRPEFTASGITVIGSSAIGPLVAWLDERATQWQLGVDGEGCVEVRRRGRSLRMTVEPVIDHDRVKVELVALRWGKMRLAPPRWLRLTRRFTVAPLPLGVSIVEAKRIGRGVAFRLAVASISRDIDAALVREAILRRLAIPLGYRVTRSGRQDGCKLGRLELRALRKRRRSRESTPRCQVRPPTCGLAGASGDTTGPTPSESGP